MAEGRAKKGAASMAIAVLFGIVAAVPSQAQDAPDAPAATTATAQPETESVVIEVPAEGAKLPEDISFTTTDVPSHPYVVETDLYTAKLPADLAVNALAIRWDDHSARFSLPGSSGALSVAGNKATYADAFPGVDVRYTALSGGLKEEILFHNEDALLTGVSFAMDLSDDLAPTTTPGGAIELETSQRVEAELEAPYVEDSDGTRAGDEVVEFAPGPLPEEVAIEVDIDAPWFSSAEREWPVIVDPTVWIKPPASEPTSRDCWINSADIDASYCHNIDHLRVGIGANGGKRRTLLRFDLWAPGRVGAGHTVTDAALNLYVDKSQTRDITKPATYRVHRVTKPWTTAVTWKSADGSADPASQWSGGVFGAGTDESETSIRGDQNGYRGFNVTSIVNGWNAADYENEGLMVKQTTETTENAIAFWSANSIDAARHPRMWVTFDNNVPSVPTMLLPYDGAPGTATTPELSAYYEDPDGDPGHVEFTLNTPAGVVTGVGTTVDSGERSTWTPPSALTNGTQYTWQAKAVDEWSSSALSTVSSFSPGVGELVCRASAVRVETAGPTPSIAEPLVVNAPSDPCQGYESDLGSDLETWSLPNGLGSITGAYATISVEPKTESAVDAGVESVKLHVGSDVIEASGISADAGVACPGLVVDGSSAIDALSVNGVAKPPDSNGSYSPITLTNGSVLHVDQLSETSGRATRRALFVDSTDHDIVVGEVVAGSYGQACDGSEPAPGFAPGPAGNLVDPGAVDDAVDLLADPSPTKQLLIVAVNVQQLKGGGKRCTKGPDDNPDHKNCNKPERESHFARRIRMMIPRHTDGPTDAMGYAPDVILMQEADCDDVETITRRINARIDMPGNSPLAADPYAPGPCRNKRDRDASGHPSWVDRLSGDTAAIYNDSTMDWPRHTWGRAREIVNEYEKNERPTDCGDDLTVEIWVEEEDGGVYDKCSYAYNVQFAFGLTESASGVRVALSTLHLRHHTGLKSKLVHDQKKLEWVRQIDRRLRQWFPQSKRVGGYVMAGDFNIGRCPEGTPKESPLADAHEPRTCRTDPLTEPEERPWWKHAVHARNYSDTVFSDHGDPSDPLGGNSMAEWDEQWHRGCRDKDTDYDCTDRVIAASRIDFILAKRVGGGLTPPTRASMDTSCGFRDRVDPLTWGQSCRTPYYNHPRRYSDHHLVWALYPFTGS